MADSPKKKTAAKSTAAKPKRAAAKQAETLDAQSALEQYKLIEAYAKALAAQAINDPDGKKSRRTSRSYGSYTKENIESYLSSPTQNEEALRNASIFLYYAHTRYRNLLQYYANIPCWCYVVNAVGFNPDKVKAETFKKQYIKTCQSLEAFHLERLMPEVCVTAMREGAYYGVIWPGGTGGSIILQKLDPKYCAIVSVGEGNVFNFAYDMSQVKEEDLDTYYPPQFRTMWNAYKASGGSKYQLVPPEVAVCVKGDPTTPEFSIPGFASVLPTLYSIQNIEDLSETATELSNYKLIAGKVPTDSNGIPAMLYGDVMQYYSHLANNVGDRVGVAFTPFDLKSFNFEQSGTAAQIDTVARANENFFAAAGTSSLLHGATNNTAGVTKLAIKVDEAYAFTLVQQCEDVINRYLRMSAGSVRFRISFLPVTVFNREEMLDQYKGALNYGIGKMQYLACLGIHQYDVQGQNYIENTVLDIDNMFTPMKTASTQTADAAEGGRPTASDSDIGDAGEATRDSGANEDR